MDRSRGDHRSGGQRRKNVVIGAGSVVTKDIPDNVLAAGNPCRVLREVSERDRECFYKDEKIDWENL